MVVIILTLTGGTAYASHRHYGYNSGASITFDYLYYPGLHLSYSNYGHPHNYRRYNHYSGHRGRHEKYGNGYGYKHGYKHARKHHNGYRDH